MKIRLLILLVVICLLSTREAYSFIVDTGEPSNESLVPFGFNNFIDSAAQFQLDQSYTISSIEVFIATGFYLPQENQSFTVSIYGNGNDVPDLTNSLFSQIRINSRVVSNTQGYLWDGVTGLNWELGPGTYWIAFEPDIFLGTIAGGAPNPLGNEAYRIAPDVGYSPLDALDLALRIDGQPFNPTAVPEPLSPILFLMGGITMSLNRRFNRAQHSSGSVLKCKRLLSDFHPNQGAGRLILIGSDDGD